MTLGQETRWPLSGKRKAQLYSHRGNTSLFCSSSMPRVYSTNGRCFVRVFKLMLLRRRLLPTDCFDASAFAYALHITDKARNSKFAGGLVPSVCRWQESRRC